MKEIKFPRKVVITSGMPYGNKPLHIGHIGVFINSDFYARYMRDRIGAENVIYICGTDGFGSTSEEKHRKLKAEGKTDLTLQEYVTNFHNNQRETLKKYNISLNNFYASCLEPAYSRHKKISAYIFENMLKNGALQKRETEQFYDETLGVVLNGRQVEGKCPIENCQSEVGYADECSLGHQYSPKDLINPISTLSGTKPSFKKITNYYISLDEYRNELFKLVEKIKEDKKTHKFMVREMRDYMVRPTLFVKSSEKDKLANLTFNRLVEQRFEEKKDRIELIFESISARDEASQILADNDIRYTSNKALAPLRITGNTEWGVPVPQIEPETKDLTFYVWPESLWAPISFTKTYLEETNSKEVWQDWWCNKDAEVTQFIGEDNIYFYCLAQPAIFMAVNGEKEIEPENNKLQMTNIVAFKHILLNNVKASSSGIIKPPSADNLLDYYTPEQLRCHFLSMNLHNASYNFKSKAFWPQEFQNAGDPMVAQGNMLTNIFNRLIRSVLYSLQSLFNGKIPANAPSPETIKEAVQTAEIYQEKVAEFKFSEIITLLDEYFRKANQDWSVRSKSDDLEQKAQLIADTIHIIKSSLPLIHPIAPSGAELVAEYLKADTKIFDWNNIEKTFAQIYPEVHEFKFLEPKFDFFKKHPSQIND